MKKLFFSTGLFLILAGAFAQEKQIPQDTVKAEKLEEVLLQSIRVDADSPITHSNMDREEIEKRNLGQGLPSLLNFLPAVVTTTDDGTGFGYSSIRVRGSDATRVNVTLNDIPYNDSESQSTIWVNLPDLASSVESLQLQRGVGTSTNGPGAFGASLNMKTDAVSYRPYAEFSNSFGSYNTRKHNARFSTGLLSDYFEVSGRFSTMKSDGYIDRASSDLKSFFLQTAYSRGNTFIKALMLSGRQKTYQAWNGLEDPEKLKNDRTFNPSGMYTDQDGNVRFYDQQVDNYDQDIYQLVWNQQYGQNWSTNLTLNYTRGLGYFEEYKEDEGFSKYNFDPVITGTDTIAQTDLIRRRWLDNHFYAVNGNVNYKDSQWDIIGGAYYGYYQGDHFGEVIWARFASNSEIRDRYYDGDAHKREFSVFSKATFRLDDAWSFFADLQGRFVNYSTSGITSDIVEMDLNKDYSFFNPKAGITYKMNPKSQLYFSYGRANREPTRSDFRNDIFTAESLDDFELGWRFGTEKTKLNTNLYFMNYRNQLVLSGELDRSGRALRTSSGKSYRFGLEIDAEIGILDNLKLRPNLALSSNKNIDFVASRNGELVNLGKTNISFSPSVIAGNLIEYHPVQQVYIGFLSKYVGEQYMGNTDSKKSKLDSYFVNDLNLGYVFDSLPVFEEVVFTVLINNIFNVKYVSNGYFYTYDVEDTSGTVTTMEGAGYYPQATTNFLAGLTLKF